MADEDTSISDALAKAREYTDKLNPLNYLFPSPSSKDIQEAKESGQKLVSDYSDALRQANAGASGLVQQGVENMKSGNPAKMLLGAGQDVLGTVSPVFSPLTAGFDVASQRATEAFGEPVGGAVERYGMIADPSHVGWLGKMGHVAAAATPIIKAGDIAKATDMAKLTEVQPRKLNPMGLYSAAEERASQLNQTAPVEQLINTIRNSPGVKTQELVDAGILMPDYQKVFEIREKYQPEINRLTKEYKLSGSEEIKKELNKLQSAMAIEEQNAFVMTPEWAGKGKISSQELAEHFNKSIPDIQKVVYGGPLRLNQQPTKFNRYTIPGGSDYQEVLYTLPRQQLPNFQENFDKLKAEANALSKHQNRIHSDLIFAQLQGGKTPEEIQELNELNKSLIAEYNDVMGQIGDLERQNREYVNERGYRSSHWEEEPDSVIVHQRTSMRKDENGNPVLHLEENQSDWGQQGRDKGLAIKPEHLDILKENAINAQKAKSQALEEKGNYFRNHPELPEMWDLNWRDRENAIDDFEEKLKSSDPKYMELINDYRDKINKWADAKRTYEKALYQGSVASGPYVNSTEAWTDFALKQAFRNAAEKGVNKIVWTPGQMQADRYSLERHIEKLDYDPSQNLLYARTPEGRGQHYTVKPEDLTDYVDRETAQKIREQMQQREDEFQIEKENGAYYIRKPNGERDVGAFQNRKDAEDAKKIFLQQYYDIDPISLSGLDLRMGGQGMKDYYDKMFYKRMESILKPHGKSYKFGKTKLSYAPHGTVSDFEEFMAETNPSFFPSDVQYAYMKGTHEKEFKDWLEKNRRQTVEVPHIEIPNEMLESIRTKGFAAHKDGGRIGYATKGSVDPTHGEPTGESASPMMDEADEIMRKLNVIPQSLSGFDMQVVQPGLPADRSAIMGGASSPASIRAALQAANSTKPEITYLKDLAAQAGMTPREYALRFSGIKSSKIPFEEWSYEHAPYLAMQPRKEFDINTMKQGDVIIPFKGDLTSAGRKISKINDMELEQPTKTEGGESYMRWNPDIWASGQSIVSALDNRAKAALKVAKEMGYKDPDAYGFHVGMGHHSGDFSTHTADAILGMLPYAKIKKMDMKDFDKFMRTEYPTLNFKGFKDFPGLSSDRLRDYLMGEGMEDARIQFSKGMNSSDLLKKGFPDVGPARFATTEPILGGMPANTTGLSIGKFHPTETVSKTPELAHRSYPVSLRGEYVGRLPTLLDRDIVFKDWSDRFDKNPPAKNYISAKNKSYDNANAYQIVTNEWLDMMNRAMEAAKREKAHGGAADDHIHDALQIAKHMGSNGDTMLAHINPHEAVILKALGGSGTINPHTGLLQFDNPDMGSYDGAGDISGNADTSGWNLGPTGNGNGGGNGGDTGSTSPSTGNGNGGDTQTSAATGASSSGSGTSAAAQANQDSTQKQIQDQIDAAVEQSKQIKSLDPTSDMAKQLGIAAPEAPQAPSVGQKAIGSYNFSDMQTASPDQLGGYTPGGISNYADVPQHPGYVDTGTTAMRLAADDPVGKSVSYYMDKLNNLDPRFATTAEGVANARLEQGIRTNVSPHGGFRTDADQAAVNAAKAAGLNPNPVAPVGSSLHQLGLGIDYGSEQSDLIDQINKEAGVYTVPNDPGHIQAIPNQPNAYQVAKAEYPSIPSGSAPATNLNVDMPTMVASAEQPQIETSQPTVNQAPKDNYTYVDNALNIANEILGIKPASAASIDEVSPQTRGISSVSTDNPLLDTPEAQMARLDWLAQNTEYPTEVPKELLGVPQESSSRWGSVDPATMARLGGNALMSNYDQGVGLKQPTQRTETLGEKQVSDLLSKVPNAETMKKVLEISEDPSLIGGLERWWTGIKAPSNASEQADLENAQRQVREMQTPNTPLTEEQFQQDLINRGYVTSGPNRAGSVGSMPDNVTTYNNNLQPTGTNSPFADQNGNVPLPPERPSDFTTMSSSSGQQNYPRGDNSNAKQIAPDGSPVYSIPLKSGQTVRQNFEEAFNDAYISGQRYFYWTNPKTGKTDRYAVSFASGGSVHGNDSVSNALRVAKQIVV